MSSSPRPQPTAHRDNLERGDQGDRDDESSTSTCSRRGYLQRVGTGAAAVGVIGAGGSKVAPQYAPVGRAEAALPALAVGVGLAASSGIILGVGFDDDELRGSDEFSSLQRLGLWADAYESAIQHEAQDLNMMGFVSDFVDFGKSNAYDEAAVEAVLEADEGATQEESIDAAADHLAEMLSNGIESLLRVAAHADGTFQNLLRDFENITDVDIEEPFYWGGDQIEDIADWGTDEFTYSLFDGREVTLEFTWLEDVDYDIGTSDGKRTLAPHLNSIGPEFEDGVYHVGDDISVEGPERSSCQLVSVGPFPYDDYDNLDEETQEEISPPVTADEYANLYGHHDINVAFNDYVNFYEETIAEVETFLESVWDDLQDDDTDPEDVLTAGMLAEMASDQDTFPYAGGSLAALGLPHSAQTVRLRFPEELDDDGEPVESTGNLYAHPMPSGGFEVGQTVDPDTVESRFWYAFHVVDDDGQQSSELGEIEQPFEIVNAERVEDGEVVEDDELTWSQTETEEPPDNWEEMQAAREDINQLEQQIADQQHEIVVDLEGDSGGGGGGFLPDFDGSVGDVASAIVGALVVLAGIFGIGYLAGN